MFTQNAARASRISQQQAMIELIRNKMSFPLLWNLLLDWVGARYCWHYEQGGFLRVMTLLEEHRKPVLKLILSQNCRKAPRTHFRA